MMLAFFSDQDVPLFKRDNGGSTPPGITINDIKDLDDILSPFLFFYFLNSNPISNLCCLNELLPRLDLKRSH